jgi:aminoglycoside 6-adenylyltransferase
VSELEQKIVSWADEEDDVRAAAVVGSQARREAPADEWSDLDVVLFARNPAVLLEREDWVRKFGAVRLTFLEPTAVGGQRERRVLYEDGTDIDFAVVPFEAIEDATAAQVAARGIRVLVDKDGELGRRLREVPPRDRPAPPTEQELTEVVTDFYYHGIWAAKKLRRGEIFTAKQAVDGYLKRLLLRMLEWHACARDSEVDTWHEGRFLEKWADPDALEELQRAYAHYDEADIRRALFATMGLFRRVAKETANLRELPYPENADSFATQMARKLLEA